MDRQAILDRIRAEAPALMNAAPASAAFARKRRPLARLDQELRVITTGALMDGRGHRPEQPHAGRRTAREAAGLGEKCERGVRRAR